VAGLCRHAGAGVGHINLAFPLFLTPAQQKEATTRRAQARCRNWRTAITAASPPCAASRGPRDLKTCRYDIAAALATVAREHREPDFAMMVLTDTDLSLADLKAAGAYFDIMQSVFSVPSRRTNSQGESRKGRAATVRKRISGEIGSMDRPAEDR
jgi:hypothetical protein